MESKLSRFVDGELSAEERRGVEEHVTSCGTCRNTLALFQKNESLLSNALATDEFGRQVVGGVMGALRRPAVARPCEEPPRGRPILALVISAALVIALMLLLAVSQDRKHEGLRRDLEQVRLQSRSADRAYQDFASLVAGRDEEYERLVRKLRVDLAFRQPGHLVAYVEPDHQLVVKATFDTREFASYSVYRRGENESDDRYAALNRADLLQPEYTDPTARPGQGYLYKFRAVRPTGEFAETAPIFMRLPLAGDMTADESLRVKCAQVGARKDVAVFDITRMVGGQEVTHIFHVKLGERVGGVVEVAGTGPVDFTTGLELEKIEEGHQPLPITYTSPALDAQGQPIMDRLESGRVVPVTTQHSASLGIRPNLRVVFRSGSTPVDLWKGSWLRVRARS